MIIKLWSVFSLGLSRARISIWTRFVKRLQSQLHYGTSTDLEMNRLEQIELWKKEAAGIRARIATLESDIRDNPLPQEIAASIKSKTENKLKAIQSADDRWPLEELLHADGDERVVERDELCRNLADVESGIESYVNLEFEFEILDEQTFAKKAGLDLPPIPPNPKDANQKKLWSDEKP